MTFNVGALDTGPCTNVHHAEMQAVRWIEEQPKPWRARLGGIAIWNLSISKALGYSPCNYCCVDLARFLTDLRALQPAPYPASIIWLTLYTGRLDCGMPTDPTNIRRLKSSGWECDKSPGC